MSSSATYCRMSSLEYCIVRPCLSLFAAYICPSGLPSGSPRYRGPSSSEADSMKSILYHTSWRFSMFFRVFLIKNRDGSHFPLPAPQGIGGGDAHRAFMPHGGCPFPRKKSAKTFLHTGHVSGMQERLCSSCLGIIARLAHKVNRRNGKSCTKRRLTNSYRAYIMTPIEGKGVLEVGLLDAFFPLYYQKGADHDEHSTGIFRQPGV